MAFYVIGIQEDGQASGDVCGPYDSRAEAEEMALSGQVPVVPLPWLLDLIERLARHDEGRAREHHERDQMEMCSYHSGCEDAMRHLAEHLNADSAR